MGAAVKQTGEQFEKSQSYLRWQTGRPTPSSSPATCRPSAARRPSSCWSSGIIKTVPDINAIIDTRFLK